MSVSSTMPGMAVGEPEGSGGADADPLELEFGTSSVAASPTREAPPSVTSAPEPVHSPPVASGLPEGVAPLRVVPGAPGKFIGPIDSSDAKGAGAGNEKSVKPAGPDAPLAAGPWLNHQSHSLSSASPTAVPQFPGLVTTSPFSSDADEDLNVAALAPQFSVPAVSPAASESSAAPAWARETVPPSLLPSPEILPGGPPGQLFPRSSLKKSVSEKNVSNNGRLSAVAAVVAVALAVGLFVFLNRGSEASDTALNDQSESHSDLLSDSPTPGESTMTGGSVAGSGPSNSTPAEPKSSNSVPKQTNATPQGPPPVMAAFGSPASGRPWNSSMWTGSNNETLFETKAQEFLKYSPDFLTVYQVPNTWKAMGDTSFITQQQNNRRLVVVLALLPMDQAGQWNQVLSGDNDAIFIGIAKKLQEHGHGSSAVILGAEANGGVYGHSATAGTAAQYRAAYRHVQGIMKKEAPHLSFWFDTKASVNPLAGISSRGVATLTTLYPGDDVVDGISMTSYDSGGLQATTDSGFATALKPPIGVGLSDAAAFARQRNKGFAVPGWGLAQKPTGNGDNPFYIGSMRTFFDRNKDILVFESYHDDPAKKGNSLRDGTNPQSAAKYHELWK